MWQTDDIGDSYDYVKFTLTNGQSDYDVKANQASLFNKIPYAKKLILDTNHDISLKFNNTSLAAIDVYAVDSPTEYINKIRIKNLFLSNSSGNDATVRIWLFI